MPTCPNCDDEIDEESKEWECPFCGYEDYGEGFYECYNCGTLFDWKEDLWGCENCNNEGICLPRRQYIGYDEFEMTNTAKKAFQMSIKVGLENIMDKCFN